MLCNGCKLLSMMAVMVKHVCKYCCILIFRLFTVMMTASAFSMCMIMLMLALMCMCMSVRYSIMSMLMAVLVLMIMSAASTSAMAVFFVCHMHCLSILLLTSSF